MEIDQGIAAERRRLERAYRALARECGRDRSLFARLWREIARGGASTRPSTTSSSSTTSGIRSSGACR